MAAAGVAFVGLGQMGQAMSKNLAQRAQLERPLLLYNRTREVAIDHCDAIGASEVAESVEDAVARSDLIFSCLASEEAVIKIFDQICAGDIQGKGFIECSTIPPEVTAALARKIEAKDATFVAMPVFGEPATAAAGNLVVVPAGPAHAIDRIRPYLEGCLAAVVIDLSNESQSLAPLLKMIGNVLIMTSIEQIAELAVFSEKAGLGHHNLRKLLEALYIKGVLRLPLMYHGHMMSGLWHQRVVRRFPLTKPSKSNELKPIVTLDAAIAVTDNVAVLAKSYEVELKSYNVARGHLKDAKEQSSGKCDILSIYGAVRTESGLDFQGKSN